MEGKYTPTINKADYEKMAATDEPLDLFELLAEPLHEELYVRQDFTFMDELTAGQQLLLSYDYVRMQVLQGGFIQLIQNGYIGLLPAMPEWLDMVDAPEMADVIDDVLKVYVLNRELLDKKTSVDEFARLYEELKEFEYIDERFNQLHEPTLKKIVHYAKEHLDEFAILA